MTIPKLTNALQKHQPTHFKKIGCIVTNNKNENPMMV